VVVSNWREELRRPMKVRRLLYIISVVYPVYLVENDPCWSTGRLDTALKSKQIQMARKHNPIKIFHPAKSLLIDGHFS
jgi:hypothetical protein